APYSRRTCSSFCCPSDSTRDAFDARCCGQSATSRFPSAEPLRPEYFL
ncbi:MAG: hypothetical protein AVDCRST_MAG93-9177, partial [uncultured Chloroflexia bacterium]